MNARYVFKIKGLPTAERVGAMPSVEHRRGFDSFKARAKSTHFGCKRKSVKAGVREFLKMYKPAEYFLVDHDSHMYHDDSFEVWYTLPEQTK